MVIGGDAELLMMGRADATLSAPRRLLAVLLLLFGAMDGMVSAQQLALAQFESRYYTLYTSLSQQEAQKYGRHMDQVYAEFLSRFGSFRSRRRGRQNFYIFRTRSDYNLQLAHFGIDASASGGMFFKTPKGRGLATFIGDQSDQRIFEVIQHEGFHQFADNYIGDTLPVWANEGIAEYFGQALIIKGKVKLGLATPQRVETIKVAVADSKALDFDNLLNYSSLEWHANMRSESDLGHLQYVQSWSIVHFLIHGKRGKYRKAFENYLFHISRGQKHPNAFNKAFGTNAVAAFQKGWGQFIEQLKPDPYSTAVRRMRFLAGGAQWLNEHTGSAPTTIEALRSTLQKKNFYIAYPSHAGMVKTDASDETLYSYLVKDELRPFELREGPEGFPPVVAAPALKPSPRIRWQRNNNDKLIFEIEYR